MREEKQKQDREVMTKTIDKAKEEIIWLTNRAKIRNEQWYHEAVNEIRYGKLELSINPQYAFITPLKLSEWQCHMFGSNGDGFSWTPVKGKEPNWFWRTMQYLCFGNRWVKGE